MTSHKSNASPESGSERDSSLTRSSTAPSIVRSGTGPRTLQGKQKSSRNSIKHGIFASAVILKGESREEFDTFLDGLWDAFQPRGAFEENLVEMLAVTRWRQRRLLIAESAEVQVTMENFESEETERLLSFGGLPMPKWGGPTTESSTNRPERSECLGLLRTLKSNIETKGFDHHHDMQILIQIYGSEDLSSDVFQLYPSAPTIAQSRAVEEFAVNFLNKIKEEIDKLQQQEDRERSDELNQRKLETLRRSVPESPKLDQFLRYSASLERSFERTLNQLDRAQRTRLGHLVTPSIDVNISRLS